MYWNKKGQTATEYMIILAVIIVIALIVVGVMGGFPQLGTNINKEKKEEIIITRTEYCMETFGYNSWSYATNKFFETDFYCWNRTRSTNITNEEFKKYIQLKECEQLFGLTFCLGITEIRDELKTHLK